MKRLTLIAALLGAALLAAGAFHLGRQSMLREVARQRAVAACIDDCAGEDDRAVPRCEVICQEKEWITTPKPTAVQEI